MVRHTKDVLADELGRDRCSEAAAPPTCAPEQEQPTPLEEAAAMLKDALRFFEGAPDEQVVVYFPSAKLRVGHLRAFALIPAQEQEQP